MFMGNSNQIESFCFKKLKNSIVFGRGNHISKADKVRYKAICERYRKHLKIFIC